jgi:putative flippase GtrA
MTRIPGVRLHPARSREAAAQMRRWMAFNLVGALGILIQLSTLAVLTGWLGLHYLVGTALAVEAAVLHNFIWHERWTWSDRAGQDKDGLWKRLVRFHMANGALSIGGNLILMRLFVGSWSMNYAVANVVTITICSFLNFLASDRFVFRRILGRPEPCGFAFRPPRLPRDEAVAGQKRVTTARVLLLGSLLPEQSRDQSKND